MDEEFINYLGVEEVELMICLCEQYPDEYAEDIAVYLMDNYVKFTVLKYIKEAIKDG